MPGIAFVLIVVLLFFALPIDLVKPLIDLDHQ
jgi:hypothetical protein